MWILFHLVLVTNAFTHQTTTAPLLQQIQVRNQFLWNVACPSFPTPTQSRNMEHFMVLGENSRDESNDQKNRKRYPQKLNPLPVLRKIIFDLNTSRARFMTRFIKLSRTAKIIVSIQMLLFTFIAGSLGRSAYQLTTQSASSASSSTLASSFSKRKRVPPVEVPYSTFMDLASKNKKGPVPGKHPAIQLNQVIIGRERISFRLEADPSDAITSKIKDSDDIASQPVVPRTVYTTKPYASQELMEFLHTNEIPFRAASTKTNNMIARTLRGAILCVYLLFMLRMYRAMSGAGPGGGGSGGGIPGKLAKKPKKNSNEPRVTFDDIEGIDRAKSEVMELVDTLRNPQKYAILGARAPKGLLLEGPPGTGKTMLARATADTAGVPLLYCSGSDFVEMFVGRGAARVRKTFEKAARMSPCIVFVDELDALGKSRDFGGGMKFQSNDEAEQTLNQLLACMDGLDSTKGICVLAATNRREVLDAALLRPGRFDRIVKVTLPDTKGREKILRVHANKLPGFEEIVGVDDRIGSLGKGNKVDLSAVAIVTRGCSGADLDFIVNEAAIRAVRRVSAKLNEKNADPSKIVPTVIPKDFEGSVANFYETRKIGGGSVGDLLGNVFK